MTAVPTRVTPVPPPFVRDAGVVGVVAVAVVVFIAGIVSGVLLGADGTSSVLMGWTAAGVAPVLAGWGLPAGTVVAYQLLLELAVFGLGGVAAWVLLRRPRSGFRTVVGVVVLLHVTLGGTAPLLLATAVPALSPVTWLTGLGWFGLFALLLVFPDGRFVPAWLRWTVPAWVVVFAVFLTLPADQPPPPLAAVALLVLLLVGVLAQVQRYRRTADSVERRQTRWVLWALLTRVVLVIMVGTWRLVLPQPGPTAAGLVFELSLTGVSYLVSALLVLTIALAVVRHRLFDAGAGVVLGRAVLFGTLTAYVLAVYGVVVGAVGLLWPAGGVVLPVLATAAAAVTLIPLRGWLQRRITSLVYGDRAEPYRVTQELGDRLAATERPEDLVQAVVDAIGPALGLQRAAVVLDGQPTATAYEDAAVGAGGQIERFGIEHQGVRVGALEVTPGWDRPLSAADRELLTGLAGQAGLAVAAARSSAELRLARDEVVAAREEERRRLHRDLHDGLGPTLASIYQRVELAGRLVESDPQTSRRLLADTGTQVRETVAEVRRLVYALRPPRLDDLGLVEAVRVAAAELAGDGHPGIEVRASRLSPAELPAVVETTAYRMVLEAVTNTVRHARADHCLVELSLVELSAAGSELVLTVQDDGVGLPHPVPAGAGLRSLRERAAEVGGRVEIVDAAPSGTRVRAWLPVAGSAQP